MTVTVLVPYGGECEWRERARVWTVDRYRRLHPDWELIEGRCAEPWSKGTAVHNAFRQATGNVLVIADADSFVASDPLQRCVAAVEATGGWAMPHDQVHRLDRYHTEKVYAGWSIPPKLTWQQLARPAYPGVIGGGIVVLSRAAYLTVNGIDPRFQGWGGEDVCFGRALLALVGLPHRPRAPLYHLWHPHALGDQADTLRGSEESEALVAEYTPAWRSPILMREVVTRWTHPD